MSLNTTIEALTFYTPMSSSISSKYTYCIKNRKLYKLDLIARTTAANATAAAARTISEVVARVQLLELTQLQVQLDIANALCNIAENLGCSVSSVALLLLRVGPDLVPWDLDLADDDNKEE
ncbi:hypothetical protein AK830_g10977 [Neonectria ditissima]|uniref:Uncharacterized protein n=1 Tax=Neonectria ditissima TaxID=78410 RepID=A0A0P7B2G7_9HYPO|nr:hypothetical protein AK830_g10977 [Neonectria ditissima]